MADETRVTVLERQAGDLAWSIAATLRPDGEVITMLTRSRGQHRATSGFGGPALAAGGAPNYWYGTHDGLPTFVMVRTAPDTVKAVVADTSDQRYEIDLTEPDERFGLRFGAIPLADGRDLRALEFTDTTGKTMNVVAHGQR